MLSKLINDQWFVSNLIVHNDFDILYNNVVMKYISYRKHNQNHVDRLVAKLYNIPIVNRRLRKYWLKRSCKKSPGDINSCWPNQAT